MKRTYCAPNQREMYNLLPTSETYPQTETAAHQNRSEPSALRTDIAMNPKYTRGSVCTMPLHDARCCAAPFASRRISSLCLEQCSIFCAGPRDFAAARLRLQANCKRKWVFFTVFFLPQNIVPHQLVMLSFIFLLFCNSLIVFPVKTVLLSLKWSTLKTKHLSGSEDVSRWSTCRSGRVCFT